MQVKGIIAKIRKYAPLFDWGTGLAVVIILITGVPGTIPKLAIVALVIFGGLSLSYHSLEKEWVTFRTKARTMVAAFTLLFVWGGLILLGWHLWPSKVFCYIRPVSEGISGVVLAMNNSGPKAIHDVSFTMVEIPNGRHIQSCKIGTVIGNQRLFVLPPCQAFFQIKSDTQWRFEIHTDEDIFMEYVTVRRDGFTAACEMTSIVDKTQLLKGECP